MILFLLFLAITVGCIGFWLWSTSSPRSDPNGRYVAEVWLEWEICRGSTMFRSRADTLVKAKAAAQRAARLADLWLPSAYRAEYSDGRPYSEPYGFEIKWGVIDTQKFPGKMWKDVPLTLVLPGRPGYTGEHRMCHPLEADADDPDA